MELWGQLTAERCMDRDRQSSNLTFSSFYCYCLILLPFKSRIPVSSILKLWVRLLTSSQGEYRKETKRKSDWFLNCLKTISKSFYPVFTQSRGKICPPPQKKRCSFLSLKQSTEKPNSGLFSRCCALRLKHLAFSQTWRSNCFMVWGVFNTVWPV